MQPPPGGGRQALRVAPGPPGQWPQAEVYSQGSGWQGDAADLRAQAAAGSRAMHGVPQVRALLRGEEARGEGHSEPLIKDKVHVSPNRPKVKSLWKISEEPLDSESKRLKKFMREKSLKLLQRKLKTHMEAMERLSVPL